MEAPKLFISYSWSSPEHEQWVLKLATELRENGVDVILDKWDLKEGQDADAFMEKMVTDDTVKKVAMICEKTYAEKADKRKGGVGTEAQIISRKIYEQTDQNKFVAVVTEKDENDRVYVPIYYQSRIYIDLSDNNLYAKNFDQLLRWVFDKPLFEKPEIGSTPSFLTDTERVSLGTTTAFRRTINAIRNGEIHSSGALNEYFDLITLNLEKMRIAVADGEFDDSVVENIKQFIPYRDEVLEILLSVAQYSYIEDSYTQVHSFFEGLIPYLTRPEGVKSFRDWDFDNFKFIIHELFLYTVAAYIKRNFYTGATYLLNQRYFFDDPYRDNNMKRFTVFSVYLESLEYRNKRLGLRRLSLHADILKERASGIFGITFKDIMQADFVLFIRDVLDTLQFGDKIKNSSSWWPTTLVYAGYRSAPFEIFARAQQKDYFDKLKRILGIPNKESLEVLVEAMSNGRIRIPNWGGLNRLSPLELMNYNLLATL